MKLKWRWFTLLTLFQMASFFVIHSLLNAKIASPDVKKTFKAQVFPQAKPLISTSGCVVPDIDPFNASILYILDQKDEELKCKANERIFEIKKNTVFLKRPLTESSVGHCFYSLLPTRKKGIMRPVRFDANDSTTINASYAKIWCEKREEDALLVNLPYRDPEVASRKGEWANLCAKSSPTDLPCRFNVHILAMDSTSRLNTIRYLPKLRNYLTTQLGALEFYGYNKVGLKSNPNMAALFSGGKYPGNDPKDEDLVWTSFASNGYWTSFGDDWASTCCAWPAGYRKNDHSFKPMALAAGDPFINKCVGGKSWGDLLYDWFLKTLDAHAAFNDSLFTYTMAVEWTHTRLNGLKQVDKPSLQLLMKMKDRGHLDNSILFLWADHGFRQSDLFATSVGRHEDSMPMLFIVFPDWFRQRYPSLYAAAVANTKRLVSTYDINETLRHLLHLATRTDRWKGDSIVPGLGSEARRFSLMTSIPENRTCQTAGIPLDFCSCYWPEGTNVSPSVAADVGAVLLNIINAGIKTFHLCVQFEFINVRECFQFTEGDKLVYFVAIKVSPGNVVFTGFLQRKQKASSINDQKVSRDIQDYEVDLMNINRGDVIGDTHLCSVRISWDAWALRDLCLCRDKVKEKERMTSNEVTE